MTYSPRTFILGSDDALYRLASAKFSRMVDDPEHHPPERFAGQRVRMVEAIVEVRERMPCAVVRLVFGGSTARMFQLMFLGPWISMTGSKTMALLLSKPNQADLVFLKELMECGKIAPVIDRRYALSEVPAAIRYLEAGHARGKVVITY